MEDMTTLQNMFEGFTLNSNYLIYGVFIGIVIDFITGITKGYKLHGKPSSSELRNGMFKKAGVILVVILGYGLSLLFSDTNYIIVGAIESYYIYMELISILENLDELGVQLPKILTKILGSKPADNDNSKSEE